MSPKATRTLKYDHTWVRRQLEHPNSVYTVAELVVLCGPNANHRQLRRWLVRKGVIEKTSGKGRDHLVELSKLKALWPALWNSIKAAWAESGKLLDEDLEPTG